MESGDIEIIKNIVKQTIEKDKKAYSKIDPERVNRQIYLILYR